MALHWIFHEHELNQSGSNTSTVQKQLQLSHSWNTMTNVLSTSSRHPLFGFADAADMGSRETHSTLMTEENKTGQYLWSVTEVKTEKNPFSFVSCSLDMG